MWCLEILINGIVCNVIRQLPIVDIVVICCVNASSFKFYLVLFCLIYLYTKVYPRWTVHKKTNVSVQPRVVPARVDKSGVWHSNSWCMARCYPLATLHFFQTTEALPAANTGGVLYVSILTCFISFKSCKYNSLLNEWAFFYNVSCQQVKHYPYTSTGSLSQFVLTWRFI